MFDLDRDAQTWCHAIGDDASPRMGEFSSVFSHRKYDTPTHVIAQTVLEWVRIKQTDQDTTAGTYRYGPRVRHP